MKHILGLRFIILFILTHLIYTNNVKLFAQSSITSNIVYTDALKKVALDSVTSNKGIYIFVSTSFCKGCVDYLMKENISKIYFFQIQNKNLVEIKNITSKFKCNNCLFYFHISNLSNIIDGENKSPILLYKTDSVSLYINYNELSVVTNDFSSKRRKVLKSIKKEINYNSKITHP